MDNTTPSVEVDTTASILVYERFYEQQILAAIFIIASVFGTVGNSLVIIAVASSKNLRTNTNVFVANLAVADVVTSLFTPWQAVAILGGDDEWPIPGAEWVCTATAFVNLLTIGCSINNLALIAVNRWVGITKSRFTTRRIYTSRKVALMVIFSWAVPLCCALIPVVTDVGELGYEKLYKSCSWVRSNPHQETYNMLIAAVYYPIQLTVVAVSYISIFYFVWKTSQETLETVTNEETRKTISKRQIDVTKNLVYVVLAFVACVTPYFISLVAYADWSYRLVPWGAAILLSNSSVNTIIYATSHPDFKKAFRHLLRCQRASRSVVRKMSTAALHNISTSVTQECLDTTNQKA
ncbi:melanopsin-like [Acanthaster planci]|uniref:Melanopsin-like n=1 Tax=Acanthaster planci TaxID=133434 RepID=A0A8B7YTW6_ACAPL|nr:melanopsin-like [Acanthaster planci]